jgi:hypothetical protein
MVVGQDGHVWLFLVVLGFVLENYSVLCDKREVKGRDEGFACNELGTGFQKWWASYSQQRLNKGSDHLR